MHHELTLLPWNIKNTIKQTPLAPRRSWNPWTEPPELAGNRTADAFLAAYRKWISLCESDRFVSYLDWPENSLLILNNGFVLTAAASPRNLPLSGSWSGATCRST